MCQLFRFSRCSRSTQHVRCWLSPQGARKHRCTDWTSVKVSGHVVPERNHWIQTVNQSQGRYEDTWVSAGRLSVPHPGPPHSRYLDDFLYIFGFWIVWNEISHACCCDYCPPSPACMLEAVITIACFKENRSLKPVKQVYETHLIIVVADHVLPLWPEMLCNPLSHCNHYWQQQLVKMCHPVHSKYDLSDQEAEIFLYGQGKLLVSDFNLLLTYIQLFINK